MRTYAKGEAQGSPAFLDSLPHLSETALLAFPREKISDGFTHVVSFKGPRITVGSLANEWRIMEALLFAKGAPSIHEPLALLTDCTPLYANIKMYSDMSSIGRGSIGGELTQEQANNLISFFELSAVKVSTIQERFGL